MRRVYPLRPRPYRYPFYSLAANIALREEPDEEEEEEEEDDEDEDDGDDNGDGYSE